VAELVMPILGADMEDGTLVAWRTEAGAHVRRGEVVAEVETEKGLIEIESFTSGTVERLLVAPGTKVPVGTRLALIAEDGAATPAGRATTAPGAGAPRTPAASAAHRAPGSSPLLPPAAAAPASRRPPDGGPHLRISPAARARAAARGLDPATITGSGPGGAVTLDDVERAAIAPPAAGAPMRHAIAAAMSRAKREIPHFYLATTIPLRRALDWLAAENASRPVSERLLPGVLLLKAVALALRDFPRLHVGPPDAIHVGVAIALRQGGLVAPAIHDTDRLDLPTLMQRLRDLVTRARAGRLRGSELSDSTITVTSLGDQGVDTVVGVIFPPQVAIVGFGRVAERPWVDDGRVVAAPVVHATLSADHRVTDGHEAARFLAAVERLLQAPEAL